MEKENFDLLFSLLSEELEKVERNHITFESAKDKRNYLNKLLSTHVVLFHLKMKCSL